MIGRNATGAAGCDRAAASRRPPSREGSADTWEAGSGREGDYHCPMRGLSVVLPKRTL